MNYFIRLLLLLLFLFIVTEAENATYSDIFDEDNIPKPGRLKRVPFHDYTPPDILNGMIKDGDEIIHIVWHKVERQLINENVPVYSVQLHPWGPTHYARPQLMKDIGKLIIYHSTTHKSVLVYCAYYDLFYGMVDRSYYIAGVPLDRLSQLEIDGRYVKRFSRVIHEFGESSHPVTPSIMRRVTGARMINQLLKKRKLDNDSDMVFKKFYIEILVFITYDVYKYIMDINKDIDGNGVLQLLIYKHLIHFYAADMLFAQLPKKDFEIYLNLAGFIVEVEDGVFSKITKNDDLKLSNGGSLDAKRLLATFKNYPNEFGFPFTKDSFDLIYLSTSRQLITPLGNIPSLHSSVRDIFAERLNNYGRSFVPMAVVRVLNTYEKYVVSVHEIARSLAIQHIDPIYKGVTVNQKQCYGIMQVTKFYCPECITWSEESINQLKSFLTYDRNRCFLINKPRSLLPPGIPLPSYSPCGQCRCFGYGCYGERKSNYCTAYVSVNSCDKPLACRKKSGMKLEPTISPLDGTICGSSKVCWDEKCLDLPTSSDSK